MIISGSVINDFIRPYIPKLSFYSTSLILINSFYTNNSEWLPKISYILLVVK